MSFHDSMLDDGYSDEEEYLEHLFDVFDKHQDEIKRLDYSEDYNQEENDDEEEEDYFFNENKWNTESFQSDVKFVRKWCKKNTKDRDKLFWAYHLSYDIPNYSDLSDFLIKWDYHSYQEWIIDCTETENYGSYWEWIENNKLENFFSGIMLEEVTDCYDDKGVYDENKVIEARVTNWDIWETLKQKYHKWINTASEEEKENFFNDIKFEIHNQKGTFSAIMQSYVEIKDKLFEEECWYIIKNILTNIKEASNVFYKVKCYKKYLKKDLNIFDI